MAPDEDGPIPTSPPLGEIRHVKAGPRGIPHTVTNVEAADGTVRFNGPAWAGQSSNYAASLDTARGDLDAAIRAALEKRMYGPDAPHSIEPEAPSAAAPPA